MRSWAEYQHPSLTSEFIGTVTSGLMLLPPHLPDHAGAHSDWEPK